jgi:hypothetical protein
MQDTRILIVKIKIRIALLNMGRTSFLIEIVDLTVWTDKIQKLRKGSFSRL